MGRKPVGHTKSHVTMASNRRPVAGTNCRSQTMTVHAAPAGKRQHPSKPPEHPVGPEKLLATVGRQQTSSTNVRAAALCLFVNPSDGSSWIVAGRWHKVGDMYVVYPDDGFDSLVGDVRKRVLCGERVSQMTKTYNDVEAVTRLLDEKEKDLELAARIGQGLLTRNKALEDRLLTVESELTAAHDTVTQLRHDLLQKSELLQIYTNDFDDSSPEGVRALTFDLLQRKVKGLEDDNRKLRAEASQLASDSSESEEREEQLLREVVAQLTEANSQIKSLDDELASKYDESTKQREEITSLLGQLVEQRQKIRDLTLENEELVMQLRVVRECQSELAAELADYKEKYAEILVLLHETQEQLKEQNKRSLPTAYTGCPTALPPRLTSNFPPDSLASELELSSLGSEGWPSDVSTSHSLPKYQFQRVFDTVRCVSQSPAVTGNCLAASTPMSANASGMLAPNVVVNASTPIAEISPSFQKAQSVLKDLVAASETEYPATSRIGVPGRPGTVDLTVALRRLTPKSTETKGQSTPASQGWRTPDSIMSTGSRSAIISLNAVQPVEKLKIIKPIEGSTTLHNWSRLAKPHLGALLEDRPGVATRELDLKHRETIKYSQELISEMYSLFDVEEDEDEFAQYSEKDCESSGPNFRLTNSSVRQPDEGIRTNPSFRRALFSSSDDYPSLDLSVNDDLKPSDNMNGIIDQSERFDSVSSYSTQTCLARALCERKTKTETATKNCWASSGLSTPCNSPGVSTPQREPFYYTPLGLIQQGAKMIRRTFTGEETPDDLSPEALVPRISRKELFDLSKMNLVEKLEKLGLDEVKQRSSGVSPMALLAALETLCYANDDESGPLDGTTPIPTNGVTRLAAKETESSTFIRRNKSTPNLETVFSPKPTSPLHRSTSDKSANNTGLNVISDLGSPGSAVAVVSNTDVCAKFRAY